MDDCSRIRIIINQVLLGKRLEQEIEMISKEEYMIWKEDFAKSLNELIKEFENDG